MVLKKENEEKDRQITVKEKQINDIIIKNNSLLLGTANIETNEISKAKKLLLNVSKIQRIVASYQIIIILAIIKQKIIQIFLMIQYILMLYQAIGIHQQEIYFLE